MKILPPKVNTMLRSTLGKLALVFSFLIATISSFAQNYSLSFDGNDPEADHAMVNAFAHGTAEMTIEAWVKVDALKAGYMTITDFDGDNPYFGFNGNDLVIYMSPGSIVARQDFVPYLNTWTHVAVTISNTSQRLYINGAEVTYTLNAGGTLGPGATAFAGSATSFGIGWFTSSDPSFDGLMDEVRIWNDIRTPTELAANMNNELVGSESGLIAYYNFNEGTGTTLGDLAGIAEPATFLNGPTNTPPADGIAAGPIWSTDAAPLINASLTFDGADDYVDLGTGIRTDLTGTSNVTVEAWVYRTTTKTFHTIFSNYNGQLQTLLRLDDSNITFWVNNGAFQNAISTSDVPLNTWTHIAGSWDGSTIRVYLDGVLDGSSSASGTLVSNGGNYRIGGEVTNEWFQGQIDEVRVWSTTRSDSDILAFKDEEIDPGTANLLAYYRMNEGAGTQLTDLSPNLYNGTFAAAPSAPAWNTTGPPLSGASPVINPLKTFSPTAVSTLGFTANWEAEASATAVFLDVDDNSDFSSPIITDQPAGLPTGSSEIISTSLVAGTIYYYRVSYDNGAIQSPESSPVSFMVQPGNAMSFDGVDDQVDAANDANIDNLSTGTIEAWVKTTDDSPGFKGIVTNDPAYGLFIDAGVLVTWDAAGVETSGTFIADGNWHHIALSYTHNAGSAISQFYVDGSPAGSPFAHNGFTGSTGTLNIGHNNTAQDFTGEIDEVRIWNVSRNATDIANNAFISLDVQNEPNLVFYINFDQAPGSVPEDISVGGAVVTKSGDADFVPSQALQLPCTDPIIAETITDNTSCSAGNGVLMVQPSTVGGEPVGNYTVSIYLSSDVTMTAIASGSGIDNATGLTASGLQADLYTVEVTNNDTGCSAVQQFAVLSNTSIPSINTGSVVVINESIGGANDGELDATGTATGGSGSYTYNWYSDAGLSTLISTNASISALTAGTYYLEVVDNASDCISSSESFDVLVAPQNALAFDGSNDHVTLNREEISGTGVTYEAWIRTNANVGPSSYAGGSGMTIIGDVDNNVGFSFGITSGLLEMHHFDGTAWGILQGTTLVNDDIWHHVAVTHEQTSGEVNLYIDGMPEATSNITWASSPTYHSYNRVGSGFNTGIIDGDFFNGQIEEVRIWNVARSATEILGNLTTIIDSAPGLVSYFDFNNSGNTLLADHAGSNNGTLTDFALSGGTSNWVASSIPSCAPNGKFIGATDSDWNDPSNWCGGVVPTTSNVTEDVVVSIDSDIIETEDLVLNANDFQVAEGANLVLDLSSNALQITNGATFTNNGTVFFEAGTNVTDVAENFINNGTIRGFFTFDNNFTNPALGTVAPGASPGCANFTSDFTNAGTLDIEVDGVTACTEYDQITVGGTANLGGTLNVVLGYTPVNGDQIIIINATTISGTFLTENLPDGNWSVAYNSPSPGQVSLNYVNPTQTAGFDGPGGVSETDGSSELQLWVKADEGTSTSVDDAIVFTWIDQSGYGRHMTAVNSPSFQSNIMNGMPVVQFVAGESDYFEASGFTDNFTSTGFTVFSVHQMTGTGDQGFIGFKSQTGLGLNQGVTFFVDDLNGDAGEMRVSSPSTGILGNNQWSANNRVPRLLSFTRSTSLLNTYDGGTNVVNNVAEGSIFNGTDPWMIGRYNNTNLKHFTGDVAEFILYEGLLNDASRTIVENYLSSKYDIVISNDLYAGDTAPNGEYDFDVAGIGNTASGSDPTANSESLTIANGGFLLDDGDYIFVGHDGTVHAHVQTDLPGGGYMNRWARDWYLDIADIGANNGLVTLTFDYLEAGLSIPSANFALITRAAGSGPYAVAATNAVVSGNQVSFTVDVASLTDGHRYTIADDLSPNYSLLFDGVDEYLSNDNAVAKQLNQGTIEAWVNVSSGTAVDWSGIAVKQLAYGMFVRSDLNANFGVYDWNAAAYTSSGVSITDDTWHHVAFTFDSGVAGGSQLYLDGAPVGAAFTYTIDAQSSDFVMAAGAPAGSQNLNGSLDEVRIWNTVRTESQIAAFKDVELNGLEPGLVAYYDFSDGPNSGTVSDLRGGNPGLPTNMEVATDWVAATHGVGVAGILDTTDPTVSISSSEPDPTAASPIPITILFSEEVAGFDLADINVINGTPSNLNTVDNVAFTADITPSGSGLVSVDIFSLTLTDLTGNGNTASPSFNITYDASPPVITATSLSSNRLFMYVEFDENIYGAADGITPVDVGDFDVTVLGGTASVTLNSLNVIAPNEIELDVTISGVPDGGELVDVTPFAASVFDVNGNIMSTSQTSNQVTLGDNSVLSFDGLDDYVRVASDVSFENQNYTLEAWISMSELPQGSDTYTILSKGSLQSDGGIDRNGYALIYGDLGGGLALALGHESSVQTEIVQHVIALSTNTWYHVAATYDGATMRLFLDGVEVASNSSLGANDIDYAGDALDFKIGTLEGTGTTDFFNGKIDEARIWNYARGDAQIFSLKDQEISGTQAGLVGYYDFSDATGSVLAEIVAGRNGTLDAGMDLFGAAGNWASGGTILAPADVTAPAITFTEDTQTISTTIIGGTVDDITSTIEVSVAGGSREAAINNGDGTWSFDLSTSPGFAGDGLYGIDAFAIDQAENEGTVNGNVTILTPGPGGISTSLSLWLKADQGVTGTTQVSQWDDQAGGLRHGTQGTATNQPALTDVAINYNPAITFDGTDDFFTSALDISPTGSPDLTTIIVFNSDQDTNLPLRKVFGHDAGNFQRSIGLDNRSGNNFNYFAGSNGVGGYFDLTATTNYISTTEYTSTDFTGFINGNQLITNGAPITGGLTNLTIGAISPSASEPWDGQIAEMIMYSGTLTVPERQQIETYLAIKYGISIDQTAPTNYFASDGNPIWDGTANATYNNNIAGIGRDDASQLSQKQSISSDGRLSIGLGTIETSNQANANVFTNDLAFLIWGDNDLDLAFGARDIVNVPSGIDSRIQRVWRASEANSDVGNVTLRFDLNGEGHPVTYNPGNFKLLLDTDADFSTGAIELTADSYAGGIVEFNGVNIANGQFFTLGISEPPVPPTNFVVYNSSPTEITFEWTDNATNETGYQILEADDFGFLSGIGVVANIAANSTLYTHTPVANKFYLVVPTNGFEDPTSQSSIEFATTDAFPGQALDFDGTGQYVSVADNDALSFGDGATDSPMSVEAWIFLDQITSRSIVSKRSGENEWHLVISSDGRVSVTLADQSSSGFLFGESPVIGFNTGEWYHIAFTYDGSSTAAGINTYVNGALQAQTPSTSGSYTAMENTNSPVEIGSLNSGASFNFDGQIDELKIWDFVKIDYSDRNASLDLSNASYPAGLVAYYPLDEGAGSNTVDRSRNTNDGTFVGGPTYVTSTASLTPPAAPTNLIAYATSTTAITLEWVDNATDETGYNIERDASPTFGAPVIVGNGLPADTQSFVDNAGVDQRFYYRVQPTNGTEDASSYSATEFGSTFSFSGQALSFDGASDYISFNTPESYSSITIEAWINTAGGANQTIYTSYDGFDGFQFAINSSNQLTFSIGDGVGAETVNSSESIATSQWTHIAVAFNGSNATFYENGSALTTSGSLSIIPNDSGLPEYIGRTNSGTNLFNGELDELKIWDIAKSDFSDRLSAAQGNEGNLVLYYSFDENIGTDVFDRSINNYDGTLTGSASFVTSAIPLASPGEVTNTDDTGAGSLRDAIAYANANPGTTITFNIGTAAPWVINLGSALPQITAANTIIDGNTQPGWIFGDPNAMVQINGSGLGNTNGINIDATNAEVYGLILTGFNGNSLNGNIYLASDVADYAIIGDSGRGNIFHGSAGGNAIYIVDGDSAIIRGNRIGTLDGSTLSPIGDHGISTTGEIDYLIIGGDFFTGEGNLISGAPANRYGMNLFGSGGGTGLSDVTIAGNKIGTNEAADGAIPNTLGGINILGEVSAVTIGGSSPSDLNIISGNGDHGIIIQAGNTFDIEGNYIGLQSDGSSALGNGGSGIRINSAAFNVNIGTTLQNFISENITYGILFDGNTSSNTALGNNIFSCNQNAAIGYGSASLTNTPVIQSVTTSEVNVDVTAADGSIVRVWLADDGCNNDQALALLGTGTVSSNSVTVSGVFPSGQHYTAMVEDLNGTSEFSAPFFFVEPYPLAEGAGEALIFDGLDDDVNLGDISQLNGVSQFTVEGWFLQDVLDVRGGMFAKIFDGSNMIRARTFEDGMLYTYVENGVDGHAAFDYSTVVSAGEWFHFAMVFDGTQPTDDQKLRVFVNGVQQTLTFSGAGVIPATTSSSLSGVDFILSENVNIATASEYWEGQIDELRIWDFAMPESSLREYLAQKVTNAHPAYANLIGYYRMDDSGDALNLQDVTGVYNGTINGAAYVASGAHLGDASFYEYTYTAGSGRNLDHFRVDNLGTDNLPLHIYRIDQTPANNTVSGFNNIDRPNYYGVFAPGQTYDAIDSVGNLTSDRRILFRADVTDPTWTSISGPLGVNTDENELFAYGQSGSGQYTTAIDQNPYPTPADAGFAMSFDGVANQVTIPDSDELSFGITTSDQPFSVEAWINLNALNANQAIVSKRQNGVNREYRLSLTSLNEIEVLFFDETSGGQLEAQTSPLTLNTNEWNHIGFTYDGSSIATGITIYLNGVSIPSTPSNITYTAMSNTPADLELGIDAGLIPLNGQLDEVRIWNITLSETNIRDHMIGKIDSNSDNLNNLVAYYRFDENSGTTAASLAGDQDGVVTGATPIVSGAPQGEGSLYSYAGTPGILNTAQFGEDINIHYQDATGGIHGYLVAGDPNQLQANGFNDLDQGKYFGVFAPGGQKVELRMDYNNGSSYDPDRRIVYRTDATDNAAVGGWERLSGLINSDVTNDSIFAYNVPQGEVSTATLNPPSAYPILSDINPGNALDFDGTDDQIDLGNIAPLSQTDAFTIEGWFNQTTLDQTRGMFIMRTDASNQIRARTWSDGNIYVYLHNGSTFNAAFDYSAFVTAGNWFHFAMVFDGTGASDADRMKVYIDGVEVTLTYNGTVPSSTPDLSAATFLISEDTDADSDYWLGRMDEFRIWNASIAPGDITAFANTTDISSHPNYSDMIAYYKFDDGIGSTILEDVFSNNDGTLVNMDENTDWVASGALTNAVLDPFITTWVTTDGQITIPTRGGSTYNYDVTWTNLTNPGIGEGSLSSQTGDAVLTGLQNTSTYQIEISGTFPVIYFNNVGDRDKIQTIEQWGDIVWETMADAFHGCTNLTYNAIDAPDLSVNTTLLRMFSEASSFNGNISNWDVSNVTNFGGMFTNAVAFNQDLSTWNTGAATNMNGMFTGATNFNSPLNWDFSKVETASSMFAGATAFNQDLSSWVTDSLTTTFTMFSGATSFNSDISSWNVSNVTLMNNMLDGASSFDQNLGGWDVSGVTDMANMLNNTALSTANYDATLAGWSGQTLQSAVNLGVAGLTYSAGAQAARDILTNPPNDWIITGDVIGTPEIEVSGLGIEIVSGDNTPDLADDTDFGNGGVSHPVVKTYKIKNLGAADLNLGANAVSASGDTAFEAGLQPDAVVSAGDSTTFTIVFTAPAENTFNSQVQINSDDPDESFYTFDVTGVGIPAAPSMQASNIIASGIADDTVNLSWTFGNGWGTVIAVFEGNDPFPSPTDNTTYTANTQFGLGDDIGGGWHVVYVGTGTSVSVTGLNPGQQYTVAALEFYGNPGAELYNTSTDVNNPINFTTTGVAITNYALDFDGIDDHVQVASPTGFPVGAAPRTLEFWFKSNVDLVSNPNHGIVQYGTNNTSQMFGLITSANAAGKLYFFGFGDDLAGVTNLIQDQWHHAAVTYDGTDLNLYLDGNLEASKTSTLNTIMDVNGLTIGRRPGLENIWDGQLDEVRLWDHARSQTEIQNNMNNTLFGSEGGLVAYYPMSDGTGSTTVTDATGGTNGAVLVSMDENTDWVAGPSLSPPNPGGSTFFEDFTDEPLPGTASSGPFVFDSGLWDGIGVLESGDIDARGGTGNAARVEPTGGNYIQTPPLDQATTFGFWYKGESTGGTYDVLASNDGGVTYSVNMGSINPNPTYQEFTLDFTSNFDPSYTGSVRIVFNSGANPLFIDDVNADVDILRGDVTLVTEPISDVTINAGDTDVLIYKVSATFSITNSAIEGLFLTPNGADSLDFESNGFDFYQNRVSDDFGSATLLGTSSWSPGDPIPRHSIGLLFNDTYAPGETVYFYVTADIRSTANAVTFNIDQPIEDNFGFGDANKIDGGLAPGANITIQAGGDVTPPNVSNLTPSLNTIIDADTQLDITITFDEIMDTGIDPTISFPVEDPSNTLTLSGGVWDDNLNFTASYSVTDADELLANIDVQVTAAQDASGNLMNTYDATDVFNIDMENPVVTVDIYGTSITSPQLTGTIDDPTATIDIGVDGGNYGAINNGDGTWVLNAGLIANLADGTYDVTVTATDDSGNMGTDLTTDELTISQTTIAIAASNITSTEFEANWSEGLDVSRYQVDVSTASDFSSFVPGFENFETADETITGVVVSNLDFSQSYYYRVRAVNTADEVSANSNVISTKTTIDPTTQADSLALRQVFNAISPQGLNWETERLRDWTGLTLDLNRTRVEVVNISGTSAAGNMPNPFTGDALANGGLSNMLEMNASDNQITGLMDYSGTAITSLNVSGNNLEFDDLEPIAGISIVDYSNQASILYNESTGSQIEVRYTTDFSLSITIGGSNNVYTWYRNDGVINSGDDFIINNATGVILAIDYDNMGTFRTEVTNTSVPGLIIDVDPQAVLAIADMEVSVTDANGDPLTAPLNGYMLETTRTATGFSVLETLENVSASTFTFPDVVLGDYIIFVESDLELYIPTYFGDVFEWTEADTLFFRSDDVIAMQMVEVPRELTAADGEGTLAVLIEEDFEDDGARVDARRRASKRKCGLRRKRSGGRTGQDDDEFELIAYGETDDNGEFQFGFLPQGTYRFFVEYPGIPLDESSFVEFEVGEAGVSDTDFKLAAFATEDGIEINIEAVLGIILEYFKDLEIYPNPSSEYLNIRYRHLKSGDVTAQLVDLSGNTKWSEDLRNGFDGQLRIDVTDFEEGVYLLRFYDRESPKDNVVTFRVIVKD